jgi:hypothetical protein
MNTLKTIYDKIGDKTELAKHEVELGKLDDLTTINKKLLALRDGSNKFFALKKQVVDYAKEQFPKVKLNLDEAEKLVSIIKAQAKELGLDVTNNPVIKQAESEISSSNSIYKIYTDYLKQPNI